MHPMDLNDSPRHPTMGRTKMTNCQFAFRRYIGFHPWPHTFSVILVSALVLTSGCASLNFKPLPPPKTDKLQSDSTPQLPNKNQLRVSQFFIFSNMELKAETPLFQELAELPEQVYRELELPRSSTLVYVYVFEDRTSYDR